MSLMTMSDELIRKAERFAQDVYRSAADKTLWKNHVRLARQYAKKLAEIEHADEFVVDISAILHDIGKCRGDEEHSVVSHELAQGFLDGLDLPGKKKRLILKCILKHSSRFSKEENEIEVKVLQSADALAILFDDDWQEFTRGVADKDDVNRLLDKALSKINLESARKIALPQIEKLRKMLG